ncbi:hypothetical protein [Streptomyces hiroshimensis]|uniref:Secreted protein n=1 Tax=Streptomyces hiroshimensis TaxID=66424 RepID=A0ABQ2Z0N0_9ACTN|nr:hypothetical protein [Streptomyces hiroshimensis]GGY01218.1 hypothetical protein GCM10010324_55040 [Streptomyces hiroshimensis]
MYTLTRLGRVATTVGAALVLATGLSTSAQAATGQFDYASANGEDLTFDNPRNGECFLLVGGALRADNDTDTRATFYEEPGDCESRVVGTLQPHMARSFQGGTIPHSVKFG